MATIAPDIIARTTELTDTAFDSFCEDIAGMFGIEMKCERRQASLETVQSLNTHFKKLAAVHVVQGRGALDGQFQLMFDQGGLFILSGVVVMLPQARILEEVKRGSIESVEHLKDSAQEVGNLLVGSWDRVFRAGCKGHQHFLKAATSIGKPLDNPAVTGLTAGLEILLVVYEMTVESYPSFKCAAIFPKSALAGMVVQNEEPPAPAAEEAPVDTSTGAAAKHSAPVPETAPPAVAQAAREVPVTPVAPSDILPPPAFGPNHARSGGASPQSGVAELLRKTAAEIMDKKVIWATPESTVQEVIALMQQNACPYILVGTQGSVEGLVSRSDILGAVSLYLRPVFAKWRRPEDDATLGVKVKWIMSRPVRTVRPDASLVAMIECMRHFGGRCLPVVDEQGSVRGIVTVFDILLHIVDADNSFSWKGGAPVAPALMI
jgi:CBS domain-containing protein